MAQLEARPPRKIYRGTVEEVFSHRNEIPPGAILELKVYDEAPVPRPAGKRTGEPKKPKDLQGYGMLAGSSTVDEYIRSKQEDIEREERPRR